MDQLNVVYKKTEIYVFRKRKKVCDIKGKEKIDYYRKATEESFFSAVAPVLILAQCFAIMPVNGVTLSNPDRVQFQWRSLRTLYTIVYLVCALLFTIALLKAQLMVGITARNVVGILFYSCAFFCGLLFLLLAKQWRELAKTWHTTEELFRKPPYKVNGWKLSTRIRVVTATMLISATIEHLLFITSNFYHLHKRKEVCGIVVNDFWEFFITSHFKFIFDVTPYHFVLSILVEFFNFSFTFGWNYMDLFIIIISIGLSVRFKSLNDRLVSVRGKALHEFFWNEVRTHYVVLCELVEYVNRKIAQILVLSCVNNTYFICFQLLNIYNKQPSTINYIYFWYSLIHLILRTAAVFFSAASIHDFSQRPLTTLKHLPTFAMCIEAERFATQVRTETIALSGMNFFDFTRKMVLGVAATVVTYELVLLQFDHDTVQQELSSHRKFCD